MNNLEFRVEEWDREDLHVQELLACASNALIAGAAFDAAVALRPNSRLALRMRARVIRKHEPDLG